MNNGVTTVCDACMKPLDGIHGTERVKKQYLGIRGSVMLKVFDKNMIAHYVYAQTPDFVGKEILHFCDGQCLNDFMDVKIMLKGEYHDKRGLEKVDYVNPEEMGKVERSSEPFESKQNILDNYQF